MILIMAVQPDDWKALLSLAAQPSLEMRQLLLRRVTELFLKDSHVLDWSELEEIGDIFSILAQELPLSAREELAFSIAHSPKAPRRIVLMLAKDDIQVARHILQLSPVLTDTDIIEFADMGSQDTLRILAQRKGISPDIRAVIMQRGDDRTLDLLESTLRDSQKRTRIQDLRAGLVMSATGDKKTA